MKRGMSSASSNNFIVVSSDVDKKKDLRKKREKLAQEANKKNRSCWVSGVMLLVVANYGALVSLILCSIRFVSVHCYQRWLQVLWMSFIFIFIVFQQRQIKSFKNELCFQMWWVRIVKVLLIRSKEKNKSKNKSQSQSQCKSRSKTKRKAKKWTEKHCHQNRNK